MRNPLLGALTLLVLLAASRPAPAVAQSLGQPDTGEPGDAMIQKYLDLEARKIERSFLEGVTTAQDWQKSRDRLKQEYFTMLGLWPLPERTPLEPRVMGTVKGNGYVVDLLHYQSVPRLYVTGNLYRPADAKPGRRLPAVLYVCGHSGQGRNGNKTAFQSFGIWFARHGYICLIVDTLQLGEIAAIHHGTYKYNRWWWYSRGYTPAGVECWNGVRGIDYLISRDDVDPERLAVTGISGGGASTFWIAAADDRVQVAVPTSGMADLRSYVPNRTINGHCDCMFLYNSYQWPWTQIAALIAPRPLLFVNSDNDPIFPMDANGRITNRLEKMYSLFGAGDRFDTLVSIGGHAYRADIRQGVYRFLNTYLKNDPRYVEDAEIDVYAPEDRATKPPIELERLRVFPFDRDIPPDELNTTIDEHFVPLAKVSPPKAGQFAAWKERLLGDLRKLPLRSLPERVPAARLIEQKGDIARLESEEGIEFYLERAAGPPAQSARRVVLVVAGEDAPGYAAAKPWIESDDTVYVCEPRGIGRTRWTSKTPNYVRRSLALLGRTVDSGRLWDVIAAARFLEAQSPAKGSLQVVGQGKSAVLAAYAGLLESEIAAVRLIDPLLTHTNPAAPQFLSVLRVLDAPDALGMLAPKPLAINVTLPADLAKMKAIYEAAQAAPSLTLGAER